MDTQNITTANASDIAELDSLLEDLDVSSSDTSLDELIEAVEEVIDTDTVMDNDLGDLDLGGAALDDEDLRKMEATIERQEAYEEQESEIVAAPVAPATTQTVVKPAKTPRAPSAPRVARDLNSVEGKFFLLEGDTLPTDQAGLDQLRADTLKLMPLQKKVAEKFENLFTSIAANRAPSTFVTIAFSLLQKTGSMSSADLVAAYKTVGAKSDTEGYNDGTARSQAGQIMNLFDTVKIATRSKQLLNVNPNSNVARHLSAALGVALYDPAT